jgi:hypothetical protein
MINASQDSSTTSEEREYEDSAVFAAVTLATPDGIVIDRIEVKRADLHESEVNLFKGELGARLAHEALKHGGNQ